MNIPGESYSCSLSKSGRTVQIMEENRFYMLSSRYLLECLGPKVVLKCFECSLYDEFAGRPVRNNSNCGNRTSHQNFRFPAA